MAEVTMYGADWCGDCRRAKKVFAALGVAYVEVDSDNDPDAIEAILRYNGGEQRIPVIVFPDGSHLTEPSDEELTAKLRAAGLA
ncbi:MAG: glutaredoxin family protein [Actinomycetota bacterium]